MIPRYVPVRSLVEAWSSDCVRIPDLLTGDIRMDQLATHRSSRCWVGDFCATIQPQLDAYINGRLRKDLQSRIGCDIRQDALLLLWEKKDSPELAGIDRSNWWKEERLEFLRGWVFNAARLSTYKRIRESQRYDHGGTQFDIHSVATGAAVREDCAKPPVLLTECPVRGASVFERMILNDATDAQLAMELGISEVGIRVIRCRVRKWFQQRHGK